MKLTALFFTILIVEIVILADMGGLPHFLNVLDDIPYGDKAGHFILFGLLEFLIARAIFSALPSRPPIRIAWTVGLILALMIGLEEYSQNYFSERSADWVDLTASYLGVFVGGYAALKIKRKPGLPKR